MTVIAALSLAAWIFLLAFRHRFWRADQVLPAGPLPEDWPEIAVIIPARDEEETIARAVRSHRQSDYPGKLKLFVCDDHSTDRTADEARRAHGQHPLALVEVPPLPGGWSGKLWALNAGVEAARAESPGAKYLLFTDADIVAGSSLLKKLVAQAERENLALASVMARLDDKGFFGGLLVPAFIYFFQKLYPFAACNDPQSETAGAAGGVVLLRKDALAKIGGLEALRGALIDDCTLARKVKLTEPREPIGLYLSSKFAEAVSLRKNDSYGAMETMVARTAYSQLHHNPALLLGTLIGLALVYIAPPAIYFSSVLTGYGTAASVALIAYGLMVFSYAPTLKRYGRPWWQGFALPLAALFYGWFTWLSAWRHWRGRGGQWKGRNYPGKSPA